jgi:hypothetical protein
MVVLYDELIVIYMEIIILSDEDNITTYSEMLNHLHIQVLFEDNIMRFISEILFLSDEE